MAALLERVAALGSPVLLLTVDLPTPGTRYQQPALGHGAAGGAGRADRAGARRAGASRLAARRASGRSAAQLRQSGRGAWRQGRVRRRIELDQGQLRSLCDLGRARLRAQVLAGAGGGKGRARPRRCALGPGGRGGRAEGVQSLRTAIGRGALDRRCRNGTRKNWGYVTGHMDTKIRVVGDAPCARLVDVI